MKKFCIIFYAIVITTNAIQSQTFELLYRTNLDDYISDAVLISEEEAAFVISSGIYDPNLPYTQTLFKLNINTGVFTDSVEMVLNSSNHMFTHAEVNFKIGDSILFITGHVKQIDPDEYHFYIAHYDLDLNLIFDTIIDDTARYVFDGKIYGDSLLTICGLHQMTFPRINFIEERDIYGNLIRNKKNILNTDLMTFYRTDEHYHVYGRSGPIKRFALLNLHDFIIDTILNYPGPFRAENAVASNDNMFYYVAGTKSTGWPHFIRNLAYLKVSSNGEILEIHTYNTNRESSHEGRNIQVTENNIFLGGTEFITDSPLPFVPEPRSIQLLKLNHDGGVIWQRFYKGEVHYRLQKVLATPDGGALLFSIRYDWNDPIPFQRDVHIMRVDSDGNYVVGVDEVAIEAKQILVYPNPANDVINFAFGPYNNLKISIFDNKGRLVHANTYQQTANIDIARFKPGLYFYTIHGRSGFVESGKFIKQ